MSNDARETNPDAPALGEHGLAPDERARLLDALREVPPPQRIGQFTVISELGRGGMGTVYEAEQDHPRRRVALKVIRPGLAGRATLRRFTYEADVLARLAHPGVARVYEAGVADAGAGPQPYFAMELVRGRPLDAYVREANPTTRQRLRLLIDICDAVHHAHTKGVIHRDLKPSNILVTQDGQPKVVDFGVARATDADVQATTLHTETGQLVGTLPYMAPEQAAGRVDELDTSSDVYALGVIAYELLSGRMPYALDGVPLHEAVRIICTDEPSRLSLVNRGLRGDVETIVGKALEKDKSRRYHTAGELAADVRRHLDYEPISARPPGTWDQLAKFARRNKAIVAGTAATLLVLLMGSTVSTYLAVVAARDRAAAQDKQREAEAVVKFLTRDVLTAATPERARDVNLSDTLVRALLAPAGESVSKRFGDRPLIEAAVRDTLAECYHALGRFELGEPHVRWALERRRALQGADHPQALTSLNNLGAVLRDQGKLGEAEPLLRDALDRRRRVLGADHADTLSSQAHLGDLLYQRDAFEDCEQLSRQTLDARRRTLGNDHADTVASLNNLARVLADRGKLAEADPLYREALATSRRTLGEDHPHTLGLLSNLASLVAAQGDQTEAEALQREALARRQRVLGPDHRDTVTSMNNLAVFLYNQKKLDDAEPLLRELPERYARVLGERHPQTLTSLSNLGSMLQNRGKLADAEPVFALLYARSRDAPVTGARRGECAALYGVCLVKLARHAHAEQPLRDALADLSKSDEPPSKTTRDVLIGLRMVCENTGRAEEAAQWRAELARWESTSRPSTVR